MKKCFIVCPIGDGNSPQRHRSDKLKTYIIEPVCKSFEIEIERSDLIYDTDEITSTIVEQLINADLVIADITDHNPNVFFEVGYRKALNKPLIILMQKGTTVPFDLSVNRVFPYDFDIENVESAKEAITKTIETMKQRSELTKDQGENVHGVTVNEQMIDLLFGIKEDIGNLRMDISNKDKEQIETIISGVMKNVPSQKSDQAVLMETLLPALMSNPDSFEKLAQLSERLKK